VENSDFGPSYDFHGIVSGSTDPNTRPHDILLSNNRIHDHVNSDGCVADPACHGAHHMGCGPTLNDSYNVTTDRGRIDNCASTIMLIKSYHFENHDVTITNSWFGLSGSNLQLDDANGPLHVYNIKLINNTFASSSFTPLSSTSTQCNGCEYKGNIDR